MKKIKITIIAVFMLLSLNLFSQVQPEAVRFTNHRDGLTYELPFQYFDRVLTSNRVLIKSIWGTTTQRVTFHGATSRQITDLIAEWKDNSSQVLIVQWAAIGSRAVGTLLHKEGDEIILNFFSSVDQFTINLPSGFEIISYDLLEWNNVIINNKWYWREIFKAKLEITGQSVDVNILSKSQHFEKTPLTQYHFNADRRHIGSLRVKAPNPGFFTIPNVAGGYILVE